MGLNFTDQADEEVMSKQDKLFQLIKRYRDIAKSVRDAEFRQCEWARDARREFASGPIGEDEFIRWCVDELGLTDGEVRWDILLRAAAFEVAPDPKTWSEIGGYRAAQKLSRHPRKAQIECINSMRATGYGVDKTMRDLGLVKSLPGPKGGTVPATPADAAKLARFIAMTLKTVPADIKRIVDRYVSEEVP